MKCYYHSADLDGHCSGAIVKMEYPECEMIGIDYGQPFDLTIIEVNEVIFMVDFCLQPFDQMIALGEKANLIWIDHHISAIETANDLSFNTEGIVRSGIGACQLVWEYLHGVKATMPEAVRMLAEYDVWNHSDTNTLPFQYGVRMLPDTTPGSPVWSHIFSEPMDYIGNGEIILRYEKSQNAKFCQIYAFESKFKGFRAICANRGFSSSQLFESVYDPNKHDLMISFVWNQNIDKWTVSLYSDQENIDCAALAKSLGGGGHKGAAGFQTRNIGFFVG